MKTFICLRKSGKYDYAQEVWNERQGGRVVQHYVRSLGRATRDKKGNIKLLGRTLPTNFTVYDYGDVQLLFSLAKQLNIPDIVNQEVDTRSDIDIGMLVTLLSIAHASGKLSLPKFQFWYLNSGLEDEVGIDPGKLNPTNISRALENISWKPSIGSETLTGDIVYKIETKLWKQLKKLSKGDPVYYDVTSIHSYSENLDIAVFGRSPEEIPQINIGLVVVGPHGFPVMHRIFAGNVTDKMTLQEIATLLKKEFKMGKNMLVLDRGFDPKTALESLRTKFNYLFMLGFQCDEICSIALSIPLEEITHTLNLFGDDYLTEVRAKLYGKKERFILGFNPKTRVKEKHARDKKVKAAYKKLENYRDKIRQGKHEKEEHIHTRIKNITRGAGKYFNYRLRRKGKRISDLTFNLNEDALQKAESLDGRWLLLCSDKNLSIHQCLQIYREKDLIEKAFGKFKGPIGIEPIGCSRIEQANSRIFISYLSYVLLSYLRFLMKKHKLDMGVEELLMKANRIKLVKAVEKGVVYSAISTIRAKEKGLLPFLKKFMKM